MVNETETDTELTNQEVLFVNGVIEADGRRLSDISHAAGLSAEEGRALFERDDIIALIKRGEIVKRTVGAVGLVVSSDHGLSTEQTAFIESAMQQAIQRAIDEGVSVEDSDEMKRRMMSARLAARKALGLGPG